MTESGRHERQKQGAEVLPDKNGEKENPIAGRGIDCLGKLTPSGAGL